MKFKYFLMLLFMNMTISYGQDIKITNYEGFDCTIDSSQRGGCENQFIYFYKLIKNNKRVKLTGYNEIRKTMIRSHSVEKDYDLLDSTNVYKKIMFSRSADFNKLKEMLDIITFNDRDKLINLNSEYFLQNEYIKTHPATEIADTMSKVKAKLNNIFNYYENCSVVRRKTIELNYKNENYKFLKSKENVYWVVYKVNSEEKISRFISPEWNIFINNLLKTKKKFKNDLQIMNIDEETKYNIGRKLLNPINVKKR